MNSLQLNSHSYHFYTHLIISIRTWFKDSTLCIKGMFGINFGIPNIYISQVSGKYLLCILMSFLTDLLQAYKHKTM
jgi:hypothetical protein